MYSSIFFVSKNKERQTAELDCANFRKQPHRLMAYNLSKENKSKTLLLNGRGDAKTDAAPRGNSRVRHGGADERGAPIRRRFDE